MALLVPGPVSRGWDQMSWPLLGEKCGTVTEHIAVRSGFLGSLGNNNPWHRDQNINDYGGHFLIMYFLVTGP